MPSLSHSRIFATSRVRWSVGAGLILLVIAAGWYWRETQPCQRTDKACLAKRYHSHVTRTPAFWAKARTQRLAARIGNAPPELVELLKLDVTLNDFPAQPRASIATPEFLADVRAAVEELPANIRDILERRLVGIHFIDDVGGSAFADIVKWGGPEGAAFIVLDPTQLSGRRANEWATWKERTPFQPDSAWQLTARIADAAGDDRKHAIQYILLHEIGHVLATRGDIHPRWDRPTGEELRHGVFPFHALSWRWDEQRKAHLTKFDDAYADRPKVRYYFGANLPRSGMLAAYEWLESTNLPSLYAATHPGDDFAESFVSYVHTELMGRPWDITLSSGDKVVKVIRSCWREPRCAEKRAVLENILATEAALQINRSQVASSPKK